MVIRLSSIFHLHVNVSGISSDTCAMQHFSSALQVVYWEKRVGVVCGRRIAANFFQVLSVTIGSLQ